MAMKTNVSGRVSYFRALPFLAPATVLYSIFVIYPLLQTIWLSFTKWNGFKTVEPVFVGLKNYRYIFTKDPVFYTALKNSFIWVILSLLIPMLLGLLLAVALNQNIVGRNFFRSVFYIPAVLAGIAVSAMWNWIYNPDFGVINSIFTYLGHPEWGQQWLGDPKLALFSIFVPYVWQATGFIMVLYLAGLQSVPQDLLEAARVDGANAWQRFWAVTVPALRPTTSVVLALTIINSLKVFDLVVGMTNGGPAQATQVLALWSYYQSFGNHTFGQGSALSTVLLGITLAIILPYLIWTLRGEKK
jgi:raffinose/stachyose/melibiose transport system permease protein